jgi:hypothetical protein
MMVEKASGRVSGRAPGSLDLAMVTAPACSMFRGKAIRPIGFSRRGEYIGERGASVGGGPGGLTPWWCGPGVGHATLG